MLPRCTRKVQFRSAMAKAPFNKEKTFFTNKLELNLSNNALTP